jgi:hypothetical protein
MFNLLTGPELFDRVEALVPEHRERLFPPTETLSMFLAQALSADGSCRQVVNDAIVKRVVGGMTPGLGFPICRVVALMCLGSGALLDTAMGPCVGKGSDEQSLLRKLLDTLEADDILLGDAFYATYFLLAALIGGGVDGVFEQHGARKRSTDFSKGEQFGARDHIITLTKPSKRPDWMGPYEYDQAPDTRVCENVLTDILLP